MLEKMKNISHLYRLKRGQELKKWMDYRQGSGEIIMTPVG